MWLEMKYLSGAEYVGRPDIHGALQMMPPSDSTATA